MSTHTTTTDGYSILFIPFGAATKQQSDSLAHQFSQAVAAGQLIPVTRWANNQQITQALNTGGWNWVAPHHTAQAAHSQAARIIRGNS